MRIQINTNTKTITLLEPVNLIELMEALEKMFPEDYRQYKVDSQVYNYVGYYPWYTWPTYTAKITTISEPIYNVIVE